MRHPFSLTYRRLNLCGLLDHTINELFVESAVTL